MTDLSLLTASQLSTGLAKKEFSSVEIAEACLNKAEKLKTLNCFLELSRERVLGFAKSADKARAGGANHPLLGVPVGIKDVLLDEGVKTTAASQILKDFVAPYDATVVRKLKMVGAIPFGKLNMDEFAMGSSNENSSFGVVKNPWNTELVPGGSSGGSAAAVASRICPLALGSDTGGSIRQPASLCGIVGLKPTYGRVSRYGVVAFASSLDQIGGLATNVKDCALITQTICGFDPNDSTSSSKDVPDFVSCLGKDIKGLRIGIPKEYFIAGIDPEVEAAVKSALKVLSGLGANIVDISLPNSKSAIAVYYIIAPAEASSNLARYDGIRYGTRVQASDLLHTYSNTRSQGFGKEVQRRILIGTYVLSSGYFDAYYKKAQQVRALVVKDFTEAFKDKCDVIVAPTAPTPAFKIGEKADDPLQMYLGDVFTIPVNLAGLPGMNVPCGISSTNLPIGMQFIGKPWDEETIFKAASAFESATDWHKRRPNL